MIIYTHSDCLLKFNGQGHPERREEASKLFCEEGVC